MLEARENENNRKRTYGEVRIKVEKNNVKLLRSSETMCAPPPVSTTHGMH